ncbi:ribosomal 5S rRNA E-loop binding protein Ctc/L25/TL5 [Thermoanaerobacter mathranii subsp. mathranii str. A3]|uniref:Large ribosomal subunit protein bL25 n=1 Tax=Thermoanaerobacter mathranii subsp. mathranii (strain DSM 11426 / CCUG 53645 / CIP 108742 / A3) TaxID=583358 RepID=A0ABN3Z3K1_THEM3|nr:50S ribosomal protein L25/general stress protein Ctc [Thermoanaerobacter mathranii]ADH61465.1 ribosomal 5S rRNA E-loop binding protein Ctc/L25/TL5 [Thermoanaerobacter mathranii subsp. mathranii str. A3]
MQSVSIEAIKRDIGKNSARRLKKQGYIPGILYGKDMTENIPLAVEYNKFQRLLQQHGRNVLFNVIVDGSTHNAVVKEIQEDTLKGKIIHIDFQRVSMHEEIEATVPLKFEGIGLIESKGGIVQHQLWELTVESLPDKIPQEIVVDLSKLEIGDTLFVKDIQVPEGVKVIDDPDEIVVSVLAPREGEEEEAEEAAETEKEGDQ